MNNSMIFLFAINIILLWLSVLVLFRIAIVTSQRLKQIKSNDITDEEFEQQRENEWRSGMLADNEPAPDFSFESLEGVVLTKAELVNQRFMLVIISPGCSTCSEILPHIQSLQQQLELKNTKLFVVSISNQEFTQEYLNVIKYESPVFVAYARDNQFRDNYQIKGIPAYYIIDKNGLIEKGGSLPTHRLPALFSYFDIRFNPEHVPN